VFQARQFYFTVAQVDDFNLTQLRVPQAGFSYSTVPTTGPQAEPQNYGNLSAVSKSLEELKPIVLSAQNYPTR
jgi:hypothetical protein